ncbi:MAG: XdhC family protein [Acidobacteria bacterium]|nr:XdhC family protein [Acidobacteriota bacterium]
MSASERVLSPYERMAELAARGTPFAVATLVRTQGSTPQVVGARLVVTADPNERPAGTLGGGCVEADAILAAREVLQSGGRALHVHQLSEELAWNTGLVCGGTMWILVEGRKDALEHDGTDLLPDALAAARGGPALAFVTHLIRGERQSLRFAARVTVMAGGRLRGTLGHPLRDEQARDLALEQMRLGTPRTVAIDEFSEMLIEPIARRPRLVVAGGGHVAKAIARQARLLDFDVTILEDRPEFADPARFDGATVMTRHVPDSIASLDYGDQAWLVIATRGHKLDADCVLAAVKTNVRYIGLLGSRRKTVLIAGMLRSEGVPEDRIAVVRAPVGLDLGGRTPAEIALAVLAEITQLRYGGSGQPLAGRRSGETSSTSGA